MPIVFPGFRTKALTFSYDDGTLQDRRLAALFRKYGLKATFNLNSGAFDEVQHGSHGGFSVNFGQKLGGGVQLLLFPAGEQPHMRAAFLYKEPPRASLAWASAMNCRA